MDATDGELARRVAARPGDEAAESALCARFARRAFLYGVKHLRDEVAAQDLAQEVLLTVLAALREGRVQEPDRIGSFVLGTCRLVAGGWQRRERRRQELSVRMVVETTVEQSHGELAPERLYGCLKRLPPREQRLLIMSFHEDRSADEIAAALGLQPGNVRVLRHRALARLRECVEPVQETAP
jgi:RNA polymerase sigma-70 factor (ECF subfamily)